ncbi:MAG: 23S rRNA (guanosine(2251)-2'-O)-methyltransferase RlmB [Xanthomonadaceae bacterium]|nr:23S rRNA (guanosine(2251)-2'-O)-methyltransferase RlmB [Xanthomonadaceae bacterium]
MSDGVTVYGLHAADAVLAHTPGRVLGAWLQEGRDDARVAAIRTRCVDEGIAVQQVGRAELDKLSGNARHQGVVLRCRPAEAWNEAALKDLVQAGGRGLLLLVLDGVTDPHNLGACLRSADAAGVHAVVAPRDRAAGLNPVARKVASGAAETVPFVQVTNLARTLRWLRDQGVWVIGAADEGADDLWTVDFNGPVALVMGAEGAGMRRLTREHCDSLVRIPMAGAVESLNVSVATGVCLFEVVRQRRSGEGTS